MSDFGEAVRASLTRDWASTVSIASKIPNTVMPMSHITHVHRHLTKLERYGVAEK